MAWPGGRVIALPPWKRAASPGRVTTPVVVAPRVIRVNVSPPAAAGAGERKPVEAGKRSIGLKV